MDEEIIEHWNAQREQSRIKKQNNKKFSTNLLIENNIPFEAFNNGTHLVVKKNGLIVDFWPSTGLFKERGSNYKGRGIKSLILFVQLRHLDE